MNFKNQQNSQSLWPDNKLSINQHEIDMLLQNCKPGFDEFVVQQQLGEAVSSMLNAVYLPLSAWVASQHKHHPVIIGVSGAQGSGKSTLSRLLAYLLSEAFNKTVQILSIDDFYLSKQRRQQLARDIHPLLAVRGVPGTHDVQQGINLLRALRSVETFMPVTLPIFSKAQDDCLPVEEGTVIDHPVDIILFEGWCVGAQPQGEHELSEDINQLEADEDSEGIWRHYVNQQLAGPYQTWFREIDYLIMLKVPDMSSIFDWRLLQEQKLEKHCLQNNIATAHIMSEHEIGRFIMYYERITRYLLNEMPSRADVLLELDKQHLIHKVVLK
ncbi:MAG: hypothetical protein OEZ38_02610 [Gammaproteobacteria bacterium]|nr:hypothetical protein [Gammaproteobacteria bacterium]